MISTLFHIFELPQWHLRLPLLESRVDDDTITITQIVGAWLAFILAFVLVMLVFDDGATDIDGPMGKQAVIPATHCAVITAPVDRDTLSQSQFKRISEITELCNVHVF